MPSVISNSGLSVPFIGVYHAVERTQSGYRLSHERNQWAFWRNGDQHFRAQPGDRVYVFFRVFSPARFDDEVSMRWFRREPRGWVPRGPGFDMHRVDVFRRATTN